MMPTGGGTQAPLLLHLGPTEVGNWWVNYGARAFNPGFVKEVDHILEKTQVLILRQYLSRGTDLSIHSQVKLNKIARQLNERPRKTLEYETPADRFNAYVA